MVAADVVGRSTQQIALGARAVTGMLVPTALLLCVAGPKLVVALYGKSYEPAGMLFVFLLPGMTALGIHLVIDAYFAGKGFPSISIWSAIAALAAKVGLNLVAVPSFGAPGAAVVTSLVYTALLTVKIGAFAGRTGTRVRTLLVPALADFRYVLTWARTRLGSQAFNDPPPSV